MIKKHAQKKGFLLFEQDEKLLNIYNIISKKLPTSIFARPDYNFFEVLVRSKIISVFCVKDRNKLASIITVVDYKNYFIFKKKVIMYLLSNPLKIFVNFTSLLKSFSRNAKTSINKDSLYLLHLVIFKNKFTKISIKQKDNILNFFFKKILKSFDAKILFLCYDRDNSKANNFYLRNKFKIYDTNSNRICVKKKINDF